MAQTLRQNGGQLTPFDDLNMTVDCPSRHIDELLLAQAASDGDGVRLLRVFGGGDLSRFDPFLMLDEFGSFAVSDYIGGFPSLLYVYEGEMEVGAQHNKVGKQSLARLSRQGDVVLRSKTSASALLITGRPISEPIVQHGPFVMNTRAEIRQAIDDFNRGRLTG